MFPKPFVVKVVKVERLTAAMLLKCHAQRSQLVLIVLHPRSHPCKSTAALALDGRLRSTVVDSRPFSLFFAIERTDDSTLTNLSYEYVKVNSQVTFEMPNGVGKKQHFKRAEERQTLPTITAQVHS